MDNNHSHLGQEKPMFFAAVSTEMVASNSAMWICCTCYVCFACRTLLGLVPRLDWERGKLSQAFFIACKDPSIAYH